MRFEVGEQSPVTSFRLQVRIEPNWDQILQTVVEKTGFPQNEIRGVGLWKKTLRYTWFQDRLSGLQMIWSEHHQTFVDHLGVGDYVFQSDRGRTVQPPGSKPEYFDYEHLI